MSSKLLSKVSEPAKPEMTGKSSLTLEICANSIQSVRNAIEAGAHRVELCSNLEQGGITPSYGLIKRALLCSKIPVHVLIRPRAGNFVYDSDEIDLMIEDIVMCKQLGCHGIVTGVLTAANTVDTKRMHQLMTHAAPLSVTFHRAFDDCKDKTKALEDIVALGCTRILTSGGRETAEDGISVLKELVLSATGRIQIMAGAGVGPENTANIIELTGVTEIHASAKALSRQHEKIVHSRFHVDVWETDPFVVASLLKQLKDVERS